MSRRNKLQKFAEVLSFPNVYENFNYKSPELIGQGGQTFDLRGKWAEQHFRNEQPITLELACGRGEYTLGLARMFPERNFIGVDVKGARIWKGAKIALQEELHNAAFLRTRIEQLGLFFAAGEVEEIWITFPDPFIKKANRRLTAPRFLDAYRKLLPPGGIVHLKTDSPELTESTLAVLAEYEHAQLLYFDSDIYGHTLLMPELELKTYYEQMHLRDGKTIKYFRIKVQTAEDH